MAPNYIRWFEEIGTGDVASVGGKNASLGEMVRKLGSRGITRNNMSRSPAPKGTKGSSTRALPRSPLRRST